MVKPSDMHLVDPEALTSSQTTPSNQPHGTSLRRGERATRSGIACQNAHCAKVEAPHRAVGWNDLAGCFAGRARIQAANICHQHQKVCLELDRQQGRQAVVVPEWGLVGRFLHKTSPGMREGLIGSGEAPNPATAGLTSEGIVWGIGATSGLIAHD